MISSPSDKGWRPSSHSIEKKKKKKKKQLGLFYWLLLFFVFNLPRERVNCTFCRNLCVSLKETKRGMKLIRKRRRQIEEDLSGCCESVSG